MHESESDSIQMASDNFVGVDTLFTVINYLESALNHKPEYTYIQLNVLRGINIGYTASENVSYSSGIQSFDHLNQFTGFYIKGKYSFINRNNFSVAGSAMAVTNSLIFGNYFGLMQLVSTYGNKTGNTSLGISATLDKFGNKQLFYHLAMSVSFSESISLMTDNQMDHNQNIITSLLLRMNSRNIIFDIGISSDLKRAPVPIVAATLGF